MKGGNSARRATPLDAGSPGRRPGGRPSSGSGTNGDIHRRILALAKSGRRFALAVILKDQGSVPRKAATKALIEADGSIHGTIGGGWVEAETQRLAVEAIRSGRAVVADLALDGGAGRPVCGGLLRILIDPGVQANRAAYAQAVEAERLRQKGLLLTSLRTCSPARAGRRGGAAVSEVSVKWVPADAAPLHGGRRREPAGFPAPRAIRAALESEMPQLLVRELAPRQEALPNSGAGGRGGAGRGAASPRDGSRRTGEQETRRMARRERLEVLVEPVIPPPLLVIAGGGHIGQALAMQAGLVGFSVLVIEDRPEFIAPALYPPGARTRCGDIAAELARLPAGGDTFIAVVTRGHEHDLEALAACIRKPAAYIGMIGSRRKVGLVRRKLLKSGAATAEEFDRVYAPIGLDIGAETVPEIAASIVGQLIAVYRNADDAV